MKTGLWAGGLQADSGLWLQVTDSLFWVHRHPGLTLPRRKGTPDPSPGSCAAACAFWWGPLDTDICIETMHTLATQISGSASQGVPCRALTLWTARMPLWEHKATFCGKGSLYFLVMQHRKDFQILILSSFSNSTKT